MSILFDKIQFQNCTHFGENRPIVAELGVLVTNIPSDVCDGDEWHTEDVPLTVDPGYYYVSMTYQAEPVNGIGMEDWGKKYIVAKESIYEYVFGYADPDEPPEYIESYDRIADAADSVFLNSFLLLNRLIDDSRTDQAPLIRYRREKMLKAEIDAVVTIERIDKFNISVGGTTDDADQKEIRLDIVLDRERNIGGFFGFGPEYTLIPSCVYVVRDQYGRVEEEYRTLDDTYNTIYFNCFVELQKKAREVVFVYLDKNASSLRKSFKAYELSALKKGILGAALGMKEYQ